MKLQGLQLRIRRPGALADADVDVLWRLRGRLIDLRPEIDPADDRAAFFACIRAAHRVAVLTDAEGEVVGFQDISVHKWPKLLILQGEYFLREEDGQVALSEDAGDALFNYDGKQDGWYLQGIFQFNRQWRAGLRYDRLSADNDLVMVSNTTGESDEDIFEESGYQSSGHDPRRWAAMVDWSPSEFSRLRLQYARDDSREVTDDQVFLQYIMTLGAHGAHQY